MFNLKTVTTGAAALALIASASFAETVIRVQSVIPAQADVLSANLPIQCNHAR